MAHLRHFAVPAMGAVAAERSPKNDDDDVDNWKFAFFSAAEHLVVRSKVESSEALAVERRFVLVSLLRYSDARTGFLHIECLGRTDFDRRF